MNDWSQSSQPYKKQGGIFLCILGLLIAETFWVYLNRPTWGLKGQYYANPDWQGTPTISKIDNQPYLKELTGYQLLSTNFYSVKWTGWIAINRSGTYKFATYSDDGSYLRINGNTVVDNGGAHGLKRVSATITLEKGVYPIEVLYAQMSGFSFMQLLWTSPKSSEEPIPAQVLFSTQPDRTDRLLRPSASILSNNIPFFWGGFAVFVTLIILIKTAKSFGMVSAVKHFLHTFYVQHRVVLGLIGLFLGSMLLIAYASLNQPIEQTEKRAWTVQANYNAPDAKLAIDRQPETRWSTNQPMQSGMFFEIDLGKSTRIEKLILFHSLSVEDYPRGYRIEISPDEIRWQPATPVDYQVSPDATHIVISPCQTRYLKIVQTGYSQKFWWSIHELYMYHPSWLPRAYQYPLMLLSLCGSDRLSALFMPVLLVAIANLRKRRSHRIGAGCHVWFFSQNFSGAISRSRYGRDHVY
jgi:hypothetical protein